jgi:hypothetical protein
MVSSNPTTPLARAWQFFLYGPQQPLLAQPARASFRRDKNMRDFFDEDDAGIAASHAWTSSNARDKALPVRLEDLSNAFAAWRTNPLARRITNLTRNHVWGKGIRPISKNKTIQKWLDKFWDHEMNLMDERIPQWIDALTLDGEVFPTFFQSEADGMTLVRALPAQQIEDIQWKAGDYEQLSAFGQRVSGDMALKWWPSILFARPSEPCAWQYAVNRMLGCIRGDGDLTTILPWLAYYSDWLEDRVERNAVLTKFYYDVTLEDASKVEEAQAKYSTPPADGTVVVHSAAEKHAVIQPQIGADDASADGYAIKLMVATGGNVPIHFLSDPGAGTNSEATSNNMNEVSYRFYEDRQAFIKRRIEHLARWAYTRAADYGAIRRFADPGITASVSDVSRVDNQKLAQAAREVATAFGTMIEKGLDRDRKLVALIYRFAGEDLDETEIGEIVARAERRAQEETKPLGGTYTEGGQSGQQQPPAATTGA